MRQNELDISTTLARAVVDTVREPFLVLDQNLRIIAASRSFYANFQIGPEKTQGQMLYDLDDGEWNIAGPCCTDRIVHALVDLGPSFR